MPFATTCPSCRAAFNVPDNLAGKKVRCAKCKEPFVVEARLPEAVPEVLPADDDRLQAGTPAPRPAPGRRPLFEPDEAGRKPQRRSAGVDDGDDEPRSRRPAPTRSSGVPVLLLVGGGLALLLVLAAGLGLGLWFLFRKSPAPDKPVAVAPPRELPPGNPVPPPMNPPPFNLGPQPPVVQPAPIELPRVEPPRVDPPRLEPPKPLVPEVAPGERPVVPLGVAQGVWKVPVDPVPDMAKLAQAPDKPLPIHGSGYEALFPSSPSTCFAVGRNLLPKDIRQVWDLGKGQQLGVIPGKLDFGDPLALSPDGKYFAGILSAQRTAVGLWSVAQRKGTQITFGTTPAFLDLLDFAAGDRLILGRRDGLKPVFQLFDLATGKPEREIRVPERSDKESFALSAGRKYLALTNDTTLFVYDLADGALVGDKPLPAVDERGSMNCYGLAFANDGKELAGLFRVSNTTYLFVWDAAKGDVTLQHKFPSDLRSTIKHGHKQRDRALQWLGDNRAWLVYGSAVIDRKSGAVAWSIPEGAQDFGQGVRHVLDPNHVAVVSGAGDKTLTVVPVPWDKVQAGATAAATSGPVASLPPVKAADWSTVRERAVGTVAWQADADPPPAAKGRLGAQPVALRGKGNETRGLYFTSPDVGQAAVLSAATAEGPIQSKVLRLERFDLTTNAPLGSFDRFPAPEGVDFQPVSDLSPDGTVFALRNGKDNKRLDLWSLAEGKHLVGFVPFERDGNAAVAWAAFLDNRRLLTSNGNGTVLLWNVPECVAAYKFDTRSHGTPTLSPGRKWLVVPDSAGWSLFDAASGEQRGRFAGLKDLPSHAPRLAVFSADGKELAGAYNTTDGRHAANVIARWDAGTGNLTGEFRMPPRPGALACSTPGKATGTWQAPGYAPAVQGLSWWGPKHLLLNRSDVIDLERKWLVYKVNQTWGGLVAASGPDARLWLVGQRSHDMPQVLNGLEFPQEIALAERVATADGGALIRPGARVGLKLEFNVEGPPAGPAEYRRLLTEQLRTWLAAHRITVADGSPTNLYVRAWQMESDEVFEVTEGNPFLPFGGRMPRPPIGRFPGMPRPPDPFRGKEVGSFKAKKVSGQVLLWDGKQAHWHVTRTFEPMPGRTGTDDDPATYQLNNQWAALAGWLSLEPPPFYAPMPPGTVSLPGYGTLSPDGVKPIPRGR